MDIEGVLVTLSRNFDWASPQVLNDLFIDDLDNFGLMFWYNDISQQHKEMEAKYGKK